ncbi:putative digeranylgeranylglycerophospholipid reductase [delta proteobacterium NaphS2]|nr:putative digeranylgeranylglycerophospholipid reductase [delta proteobacterium NaphS2]
MKPVTCDILIIGAGPAGSSAAITAAKMGMDVLVVEQRPEIGVPVQCAEYIPAPFVGQLNMGTGFVVQKVSKMRTILPDGSGTEMAAPGFMIHRDRFDQALAEKAIDLGAGFLLSTKAAKRTEKGQVIIKKASGETRIIGPRIIIGADGPRSRTASWCAVSTRDLLPAIQYSLRLRAPMDHTEIYLSPEFYGGYGWLFPKGETANVGLGMKHRNAPLKGIRPLLLEFVEQLRKTDKIEGQPLGSTGGMIPAAPLEKAVYGNILLAGDAAGHTHPVTGAGVFTAVSCGRMAGRWAAEAIKKKNLGLLSKYDHEWRDLFGRTLDRAREKRRIMEREWTRFDQIIKSCWIGFR